MAADRTEAEDLEGKPARPCRRPAAAEGPRRREATLTRDHHEPVSPVVASTNSFSNVSDQAHKTVPQSQSQPVPPSLFAATLEDADSL